MEGGGSEGGRGGGGRRLTEGSDWGLRVGGVLGLCGGGDGTGGAEGYPMLHIMGLTAIFGVFR